MRTLSWSVYITHEPPVFAHWGLVFIQTTLFVFIIQPVSYFCFIISTDSDNGLLFILSMKILLIRHGETTGDLEDRYGGSYDDHLTDKGREQLAHTATQVADKGIEIIFHSPLIRARES